ncbi:MAG: ion channel [Actinomycetota bacterium]|nr:ion channel [Actinomycetota bacterium]MDQ3627601.1 ion channel [Actinomycetota bacterium]
MLSRVLFVLVRRLTKLVDRRRRSTELAGPLALLVTAAVWTWLLILGFALIYLPHMPEGFTFASGLSSSSSSDLLASVYLSLVALASLGLGDIRPDDLLLRLVVPFEALLGFLLLTAW